MNRSDFWLKYRLYYLGLTVGFLLGLFWGWVIWRLGG